MPRGERVEGWRRVWIVARREIRERGASRGFLISTVAVLVLVVAGVVLPSIVDVGTKGYHLGLAGAVRPGTVAALTVQAKAADRSLEITGYPTVAQGESAVREKKIDALLVDGTRLEWRRAADGGLTAIVTNAVQAVQIRAQALRLGISSSRLRQLLVPVTVTSERIGSSTADEETQAVAVIAISLLLIALTMYGSFVLTGVVQEKSSRVVEVLLARMPAREVLAGKVLGIGALGLGQFALVAVTAAISIQVVGRADAPDVPGSLLAWLVVWFVLGFAFYSVVYAALGALTSRLEDAQSASAPVTYLLLAGFWATLFAQDNPDAPATTWLSFFPPTAPLTMPMRIALGAAPVWQVVASALLTLAAAVVLVRVAGRIYSGALLRLGARVPLRDAWRSTSA